MICNNQPGGGGEMENGEAGAGVKATTMMVVVACKTMVDGGSQ